MLTNVCRRGLHEDVCLCFENNNIENKCKSYTSLQFTTTFANVKTVEYQTAGVWDVYVEDTTTGPNDAWSWINVTFKDNLIY